jgi:magnesium transporter
MRSLVKNRSKKAGLPPGTPVFIGGKKDGPVKITVIDYSLDRFEEKVVSSVEECFPFKDTPSVTWINVDGVHDVSIIQKIGDCFKFHPLLVEDIANTEQRPKFEDFGDYMFFVLKMLQYDKERHMTKIEQVCLVVGGNFVISFQEDVGDVFDPVRQRIREGKGRLRGSGPDYLTYRLIDAIVDNYFAVLEGVGDDIEVLEEEVIKNPTPVTISRIHNLKREMIFVRRSVWPLREVILGMERSDSQLVKKGTRVYLRDIYDHTVHIIDTMETFRDVISGLLDIYLSSINNRLNEVMRVLTVIATFFMPLTFFAGVYGMNFHTEKSPYNMPELAWYYGYPFFWSVCIVVTVIMLVYFRRKKWI